MSHPYSTCGLDAVNGLDVLSSVGPNSSPDVLIPIYSDLSTNIPFLQLDMDLIHHDDECDIQTQFRSHFSFQDLRTLFTSDSALEHCIWKSQSAHLSSNIHASTANLLHLTLAWHMCVTLCHWTCMCVVVFGHDCWVHRQCLRFCFKTVAIMFFQLVCSTSKWWMAGGCGIMLNRWWWCSILKWLWESCWGGATYQTQAL